MTSASCFLRVSLPSYPTFLLIASECGAMASAFALAHSCFSGDFTWEATLVPIPNTTVKLPGPMIVPTSAKVGYRRNHSTACGSHEPQAFFMGLAPVDLFRNARPHRRAACENGNRSQPKKGDRHNSVRLGFCGEANLPTFCWFLMRHQRIKPTMCSSIILRKFRAEQYWERSI